MTDTIEDTINSNNSNSNSTDEIAVGKENRNMETEIAESNDTVPLPANDKLSTDDALSCTGSTVSGSGANTNKRSLEEDEAPAEFASTATATAAAESKRENDENNTIVDIHRPVKRARSAYFIFADERRAELQKQHPGGGVAVVARALGQIWTSLSEAEKLPYQQMAAKERERVQLQVEAWKAAGGGVGEPQSGNNNNNSSSHDTGTTTFPVARIRKICKLDPEVKNLSKEALLLVTKAAELALAKLGKECVKTAQIQNRRKLLPDDVAQVCAVREQFAFLREDIVDLHRQQMDEAEKAKTDKPTTKKDGAAAASMKNSKPLTDYFKAAAN